MTTKKPSSVDGRMGRNPFAAKTPQAQAQAHKPAPVVETASAESLTAPKEPSSLFERVAIQMPIHLVFMGIKSWVLVTEVLRAARAELRQA